MKTEHLFRPAVPFLAAISFLASAQAHSADLVKPVNSNVIALPAVQKPVVDVKPLIDAKPVIDVKPVSIKPVVAPVVTLKEPGLPTERKSGAIQPAAMDEKAMTVKTFTPATISSKESASPPIGETVGLAK